MKMRVMIGFAVALGLTTSTVSMASINRSSDSAAYQQKTRVAKSGKSVKNVPSRKSGGTRYRQPSANPSSLTNCSKRSKVGIFAQTAYVAPAANDVFMKGLKKNGIE